jgi:hypothetical protein
MMLKIEKIVQREKIHPRKNKILVQKILLRKKERSNLKLEEARIACARECTKESIRLRKGNHDVKSEYSKYFKDCMKRKMQEPKDFEFRKNS